VLRHYPSKQKLVLKSVFSTERNINSLWPKWLSNFTRPRKSQMDNSNHCFADVVHRRFDVDGESNTARQEVLFDILS
jgi:hypothetical protein